MDMSLGMPEILVLLVVLLLVYGIAGKRPSLSVWAVMLLAGGAFLAMTLLYLLRADVVVHSGPRPVVVMHDEFGHSMLPPMAPSAPGIQARAPFLALLLMAGAALAVIFLLWRASCSTKAAGGGFRWWPASLLLLVLPLFLFFGSVRVEQSDHTAIWTPNPPHFEQIRDIPSAPPDMARQQAEIHRQAIEAAGEIQRRIASMNIYELMDKFDAPRIALPVPPVEAPVHEREAISSGSATAALVSSEPAAYNTIVAAEAPVELTAEAEAAEHATSTTDINEVAAAVPSDVAADAPRAVSSAPQVPPPAWVDQPPKRVGHVRREVVATDEYATVEECYLAADILLQIKTYEHLRWLTGNREDADKYIHLDRTTLSPSELATHATGLFRQMQDAGITVDYIRREIAKDEHLKTVDRSVGPMKKLYTLMEFSPSVDEELRRRWEASQRQARFAFVGFGAGSVLGLLGLAWGLLKVDTMTKGYYTKRLFLGVPLGILGLLGLLVLFMADHF